MRSCATRPLDERADERDTCSGFRDGDAGPPRPCGGERRARVAPTSRLRGATPRLVALLLSLLTVPSVTWATGAVGAQTSVVWHGAQPAAGVGRLGTASEVTAVDCVAPGACTAAGWVRELWAVPAPVEAFVVAEIGGRWQRAEELPGIRSLNSGDDAEVTTLACAAVGQCVAGGDYRDAAGRTQPFLADERGGAWGNAAPVANAASGGVPNDPTRGARVSDVACPAPGECVAVGWTTDDDGVSRPFVDVERRGAWAAATGLAGVPAGAAVQLGVLSCPALGVCVAAGTLTDARGARGVAAWLRGARWSAPVVVAGDGVTSLSCPTTTSCAATSGAYLLAQRGAGWATVVVRAQAHPELRAIACTSPGNCVAGGSDEVYVRPTELSAQGIVVVEEHGHWRPARELAGLRRLNVGRYASVAELACVGPGDCTAVGSYTTSNVTLGGDAFVAAEVNGSWAAAEEVPGLGRLDAGGDAGASGLSCATRCTLTGWYRNAFGATIGFVAVGVFPRPANAGL